MGELLTGRILVHPQRPHPRAQFPDLCLRLFRPGPEESDPGTAAMGTSSGHWFRMAAVMAFHQLFPGMVYQRNGAVGTAESFPTVPAQDKSGKSPPVQEDDGLFPIFHGGFQLVTQGIGKDGPVALLEFFPHIHNGYFGEMAAGFGPMGQPQMGVDAFFRQIIGFQIRRGGPQDHRHFPIVRPVLGHQPSMITGPFFLFVSPFMLFIDEDQPQRRKRTEHCRPYPDQYPCLAGTHPAPHIGPFTGGQPAPPNQALKRLTICPVRAISGTRTITCRPA